MGLAPSHKYSPGLRPKGVSESFLDGPMVKGSYFQLILRTPAAQKLGVVEYMEAIVRPFGAPWPNLFDLLVDREGIQK